MNNIEQLRIKSGFWYLATCYSKWRPSLSREDALEDATLQAAKIRGELLKRGVIAFSPIVHSHPVAVAANIDPLDHSIWLPDDLPFFEASHGILVSAMDGWRDSYGIGKEIEWARRMNRPRFLIDPTSLDWTALP